jgi:hypothetical protein
MATKDKYDKIRDMDIPQEAKNTLKDREVRKEYEGFMGKDKPKPKPKPKPVPKKPATPVKKARGGVATKSKTKSRKMCK